MRAGSGNVPGRAIRLILGLQIGLGLLLFGHDLAGGWPGLLPRSDEPGMSEPVRPGDQTRRLAPAPLFPGLPRLPRNDGPPMPDRLTMNTETDGDLGVLTLRGAIAVGDAERVAALLEREAVSLVRLDSPGGSVEDALAIGRQLRVAGLATEAGPGAVCLSACPYVLAGGVARTVDDRAAVGVHQHYFGESTVLPAFMAVENIQRGQAEVVGYLSEMGIDLRIMQPAMSTPPNRIYILVREELEDFGLITTDG